ncbi:MAG: hypothetical protein LBD10_09950 [Desulfobulbus sp.]|uniref:SIR2 family NAD-dependent protein deacylase n=1 Tax=Desulfobulbus sp. TaxID=895 RepID=UPI002840303A|nr:Sir2 family NAD-dependent protein deacetylase [Desulfobulbus sp.]MDR2550505.1 hypothetical protein [Desulfobulbus sp.]
MKNAVRNVLRKIAQRNGGITILTGAGISAESGIPTFRGPEGYWTVGSQIYHPQEMATFWMFSQQPDEVWKWYLYRLGVCRAAEPNPGHQALVAMEQRFGDRFTLITQNVDGLHLRAGNSPERTYQIHGNIEYMRCSLECSGTVYPIPHAVQPKTKDDRLTDQDRELLCCPLCGARARPHVLLFDEKTSIITTSTARSRRPGKPRCCSWSGPPAPPTCPIRWPARSINGAASSSMSTSRPIPSPAWPKAAAAVFLSSNQALRLCPPSWRPWRPVDAALPRRSPIPRPDTLFTAQQRRFSHYSAPRPIA